ncbi:hypothetical protein CHS0354_025849 [Potamilus streckersoni]|uniref:Uncharacterized protein n=1 Tax=Potamilus streckersoni TaxID=2493646 RepID=A0AAE0VSU5_9BIVA|nr:hypothetical protein CHS0354_025849 [Potamilus streckersoni]
MDETQIGSVSSVGSETDICLEPNAGSLPISKAVFELLQYGFLKRDTTARQPFRKVSISIKAAKTVIYPNAQILFYVKVFFSRDIGIGEFQKDIDIFENLIFLLLAMQKFEDESHICIQHPCEILKEKVITQQSFMLDITEEKPRLKCIQMCEKQSNKPKHCSFHIRIYQSSRNMIEEGHRVFKLLKLLNIFWPGIHLKFQMKIGEVTSQSDFRFHSIREISPEMQIISDASFYLQDCECTFLRPEISCGKSFTNIHIQDSSAGIDFQVNMLCVATCLSVEKVCSSEQHIITLSLFGPESVPIFQNVGFEEMKDNYNPLKQIFLSQLGLMLMDAEESITFAQGMLPSIWQIMVKWDDLKQVDAGSFVIPVHLIFDLHKYEICQKKHAFHKWLQRNIETLIAKENSQIQKLLMQALQKLFQPIRKQRMVADIIHSSIQSVTNSVHNIVLQSTSETFRNKCFSQLQVSSSTELKQKLEEKLTAISKVRHNMGVMHFVNKSWSDASNQMESAASKTSNVATREDIEKLSQVMEENNFNQVDDAQFYNCSQVETNTNGHHSGYVLDNDFDHILWELEDEIKDTQCSINHECHLPFRHSLSLGNSEGKSDLYPVLSITDENKCYGIGHVNLHKERVDLKYITGLNKINFDTITCKPETGIDKNIVPASTAVSQEGPVISTPSKNFQENEDFMQITEDMTILTQDESACTDNKSPCCEEYYSKCEVQAEEAMDDWFDEVLGDVQDWLDKF